MIRLPLPRSPKGNRALRFDLVVLAAHWLTLRKQAVYIPELQHSMIGGNPAAYLNRSESCIQKEG